MKPHHLTELPVPAPHSLNEPMVAQMVKSLPAVHETQDSIPVSGRPLEEEMATHSGIPAWSIPWTEKPSRLQFMGLQRVGHN